MLVNEQADSPLLFDADEILDCIMENSIDCIVIKDKQGRYIWINNAGCAFLNRSLEEVIGKTDFDLFEKEAALVIRNTDQEVMMQDITHTYEAFLKPSHAHGRQFKAIKRAYKNSHGEIQGIINIVRDITNATSAITKERAG